MPRAAAGLLLAGLLPVLLGACRASDQRVAGRRDLAGGLMLVADQARTLLGAAVPAATEAAGELDRLARAAPLGSTQ